MNRHDQLVFIIRSAFFVGAFGLASTAFCQNVGIGFSNPQSKLTVNGNIAVGTDYNAAAPTNGAIIEGAVGIGTTAPLQMLHVLDGNIYCNSSAGSSSVLLVNNDGGIRVFRNGSLYPSDSPFDNGYIDFQSTESENIPDTRIFYYVGLSSQNPPLNAGSGLAFEAGDPNGAPQMLLESATGNLGLGTNTPRFKEEAVGLIGVISSAAEAYPSTENAFTIGWNILQQGDGIAELVNYCGTGGGNAFDFFLLPNSGRPTTSNIISDISRAGAYQQLSDERVKTNVQPLRYGLRELMALEPKEYDFHLVQSMADGKPKFAAGELHQIGFLAQQVAKVLPEAVEKPADPKTEFYRMGYSSFIPVLVNAVQQLKHLQDETLTEQQRKLSEASSKISEQEKKLAEQEQKIAELEASNARLTALATEVDVLKKVVFSRQEKNSIGRTIALQQ
jgi:hypothetical protein